MNRSLATLAVLPATPNSFISNTYKTPSSQPLYMQHLQAPPASVASERLITPVDATLTKNSPLNFFKCNTYKKQGGPPLAQPRPP
jgi:hypothetical protein